MTAAGGAGDARARPRPVLASRRAVLSVAMLGACAGPERPTPALGRERLIVAAESWHTDLCLAADVVRGSALAPVAAAAPDAAAFAFGFGLDSWMRAAEPGSAEALGAILGGAGAIAVRALPSPVPPAANEHVALRLPPGGTAAIATFVTGQLAAPLPVATPDGAWILAPSRLRYSVAFTCNTWVMRALAEAGLPVPARGIRLRSAAMAALRAEARRQARG